MPANPGARLRLTTTLVVALSTLRIGHAVDRRPCILAGGRVHDVVSSDDQRDIGSGEVVVDLIQIQQDVIRHVGLGEEDVHVSWHPSRHGVDGVPHRDPTSFEAVCELADGVLGLGDGQTVAGNHDHRVGVGQRHRHIVDGGATYRVLADRARCGGGSAERGK